MKFRTFILFTLICSGLSAQTTISGSFNYDGLVRSYRIYVPAVYNPVTAVPLILNLHGYSSNNIQQELYGDFRAIADTANFIIVHPNGTPDVSGNLNWNNFGLSSVDDVGFLSVLIDTVKAGYNIDDNCIYSTGMSNGGFMSYDLACFLSNRIAAIASVTGAMIWPRLNSCNPSHPVPVMQIHGTADATVPYNGSGSFVGIDSLVRFWAAFNNCSLSPVFTAVPNINLFDGCTAEHYSFQTAGSLSYVELFKVVGGGHSWPGAPVNLNVTNMDFSASIEIWKFFRRFKLNTLTAVQNDQQVSDVAFYPNPTGGEIHFVFSEHSERSFSLYNSLGELVLSFQSSAPEQSVFLPLPGFYIMKVSDRKGTKSLKLVRN